MLSIELTTVSDMKQEYFGTTDIIGTLDAMSARRASSKARIELSGLAYDKSLFPYEAQGPFETPLPTLAEISAQIAAEIAKGSLSQSEFGHDVRMGPYRVKISPDTDVMQEAENLIYLERNSSVRIPKLYAAFASQDADPCSLNEPNEAQTTSTGDDKKKTMYYYAIVEHIEGCSFRDIMDEIEESKNCLPAWKISELVGEQLRKLRSVPAEHPELYGRVGGKPFTTNWSFRCPPAPDYNDYGPFDYETLVDRLDHSGKINYVMVNDEIDPWDRMLYQKAKSVLIDNLDPDDRRPVLTLMEVGQHNITVKPVRDKTGNIVDISEVVFTEWQGMCWMPAWFDAAYYQHLTRSRSNIDCCSAHIVLQAMGHVSIVPVLFYEYCAFKALWLL